MILQPGYLPWLGFFDQMAQCDLFIYYDDVQFDKHGWRNRNRIKTAQGPLWLTVPVRHHNLDAPAMQEVEIVSQVSWRKKHLGSIKQHYGKAKYFQTLYEPLQKILNQDWRKLIDLDMALVEMFRNYLEIHTPIVRSSELEVAGNKSTRLLALCKKVGADCYLTGDAARSYLEPELFQKEGVAVEWHGYQHPIYSQQYTGFTPYLSIVDLIFNLGDESKKFFK